MKRVPFPGAGRDLLVSLCILAGILIGMFAEKLNERARWGSCTSMQVTTASKGDRPTAVEIRRDMER